jgi:hypothetical protein
MIDKISSNSAFFAAKNGLNNAVSSANQINQAVANAEVDAKKIIDMHVAKQNVNVQIANVKAAVDTGEKILDILA